MMGQKDMAVINRVSKLRQSWREREKWDQDKGGDRDKDISG